MNLKVVLVFLALSLITVFALAYVLLTSQGSSSQPPRCPSVSYSAQPWTHPGQSQLFADLSREELMAVMSFLTQKLGPGLVDAAQAHPFDNCVFSVELQLPPKAAALAYLDRGSPPPAREALAIVFFGGQAQPNVTELVVGPLPHPSYLRDVTVERHGGPLPYHRRPVLGTESAQMWKHLKEMELPKAPVFLASVFNYSGSTLAALHATPRGLRSGDRATWIALYHNISGVGIFLHPVGLELLLDHRALDPARWAVQQVFYLGRYYADLGLKNWVVAEDVVFKPVAAPWSPEHQLQRPQLTRQVLGREDLTAFFLGNPLPRYLYLASNQTNSWGHQRGYRIQIHSPLGIHVPLDSDMERALSWGRYQLVVTRRKEEESQSSSIYYQNDIWTPTTAFADFINNETLLGEDLVAWVTASFLHIPHAEDVPNTVTLGNRVGFLLRPYNFFDEDPSIFSPGSVYFEKGQDAGLCGVNHVACIPHLAACVPDLPPFSYQDL
ncbi:retina-specific copper amine oxidase isoform X3 [Balaenoptera musculus]|uniref:Amine oxidase n=1 Tax=Balaenoptera musculus TaxID=9771 RepID=A0A8B8W383_BALMU|nr:retina-specific copper amine oxidase isoform X3 [Balaenoptera musculus]